jgi:galactitol-specific phosphotransferase system IIB component
MKNFKPIVVVMAAAFFMLPVAVLGQNNKASSVGQNIIQNFCNTINNASSKLMERLTERESKIQDIINQRVGQELKRQERDVKLEQLRLQWNSKREEYYVKLEEKAADDYQKQAVTDFKKAVEAAINARRAAIDAAIDNYREAIDDAVNSKRSKAQSLIEGYRNQVSIALEQMQTACNSGDGSAVTIRTNLKNALQNAKNEFIADKKDIDKIKDEIQAAQQEFKIAKEKAIADFKTAMEKAKSDLKAAMESKNSSE